MDGRRKNTQSLQQRRAAIYRRRKSKPTKAQRSRLEAAKTVLRRHHSDVYDAGIDDPRFEGLINVGARKYTSTEVIEMAAAILAKEETRNRELRSLYLEDGKHKHGTRHQ